MTDDDNNHRYRSRDPYGQHPAPDDQTSDPLAELARLIGQADAIHNQHRSDRHAAHYDDQRDHPPAYMDDPAAYPESSSMEHHADDNRHDAPFLHEPAFGRDAPREPEFEPEAPQDAQWQGPSDPTLDRMMSAVRAAPPFEQSQDFGHRGALDRSLPLMADPVAPAVSQQPADLDQFRAAVPPRSFSGFASAAPLEPASMPPPNHDEYYDDAPSSGRRRGMLTVAAVMALAVLGTGAAFGYRTFFGGPTVKSPPPVIRASTEPNKIAPPPQVDPKETSKITYDRFADRSQNEKVVVREEKPVDVSEITRSGPPRPAAGAAIAAPAPTPPPAAAAPPSVLTEPKRVRTVPIRPDAPDASLSRPQMAAAVPPMQRAPQRQEAPAANAPLNLADPQPQARAPAPPVRTAARPEPAAGTVPLSLAPENGSATASAPARTPAPRAAANGNYLVQVSSQRSEADAQAAFRTIKSKYGSVLGSHQSVIRRAELAGRGTYYRAMVGPFASRSEAVQLCSSLKAAGGDCVVQSN